LGVVKVEKLGTDAVPQKINLQGCLDSSGVFINHPVNMEFGIYDEGGSPVWGPTTQSVSVENGLFNTILINVPYSVFQSGDPRLLQVRVENQSPFPRIEITSVGFAFRSVKSDTASYAYAASISRPITPPIGTNEIADGAATTPKIADRAVTNAKIDDNAVNSAKIQDNTVTSADIQDGTITTSKIADNAVSTSKIADNAVTNTKIASGITDTKISGTGTVINNLNADMLDGYHSSNIPVPSHTHSLTLSGNVTGSGSVPGTISTTLADGSVTNAKLGSNAVTSSKISDGEVQSADIASSAVTSSKIADGAVTSTKIANNNILSSHIVDGAVTASKFSFPLSASYGGTMLSFTRTSGSGCAVYSRGVDYGIYGMANATSGIRGGGSFGIDGGSQWAMVSYHSGSTFYKILGSGGNVSCIMPTSGGRRILFAPESPEPYFEDFGQGYLENGHARVNLDKLYLDCIKTDATHPLKVFIQLNDDCNGVYVKSNGTGFDVYELQNGQSNASFTYRVIGNRKDTPFHRFPRAEDEGVPLMQPGSDQGSER
jgi:hypothetical protein